MPRGPRPHKRTRPTSAPASEGIKLTRVHHGFLRAGALGGGAHLGIPYPQMAERRAAVAAISMVTAGVEARSWTRSRGTTSLPRAGRWSVQTLCAQTSGLSTLTAGQGRRQPIKSAATNKGGVDSKAVFLRPRPVGGALKYLLKIDRLCFDGQPDQTVQTKGGQ